MMYEPLPLDVAFVGVLALYVGGALLATGSRALTLVTGALVVAAACVLIYAGVAHV